MFKIKPLNRESISDDDGPVIRKEAQVRNKHHVLFSVAYYNFIFILIGGERSGKI